MMNSLSFGALTRTVVSLWAVILAWRTSLEMCGSVFAILGRYGLKTTVRSSENLSSAV